MRKKDELAPGGNTCMAHAHDEEMVFVLLGRDAAAPVAIRAWVAERLRLGKNVATDDQITEALACAATMEKEGRQWIDPRVEMIARILRDHIKGTEAYATLGARAELVNLAARAYAIASDIVAEVLIRTAVSTSKDTVLER